MDTHTHSPIVCRFGNCGKPADVTVTIDYPATADRRAFTWDGGGRCKTCLPFEKQLARISGATVTESPAEAPVEVSA